MTAYVYVIALKPIGLCKIGSSFNPRDRLNWLRYWHGEAVAKAIGKRKAFMSLVATLPCRDRAEAYAIERAAHALLDEHRLRGMRGRWSYIPGRPEWFWVRKQIAMRAVDDAAALWRQPPLPLDCFARS